MVTERIATPPPRRIPPQRARRSGHEAAPAASGLSATIEADDLTTVIRLRGSLRAATAATVRETVETVLATRPAGVVLDLAGVVAEDELGLWVVPAVAGDAQRCGVLLTVVAPDRKLRIRLRRLGARPIEITDTAPVQG